MPSWLVAQPLTNKLAAVEPSQEPEHIAAAERKVPTGAGKVVVGNTAADTVAAARTDLAKLAVAAHGTPGPSSPAERASIGEFLE